MVHPPAFWRHGVRSFWPVLLAPLGVAVAAVTARRIARSGWRAPVPVICCGNVTVGGAGKTTLALDLAARLRARGVAVHILLRGYGGAVGSGCRGMRRGAYRDVLRGAHRDLSREAKRDLSRGAYCVAPGDPASLVGDEALLLAEIAPTWVGGDRAVSARAAIAAGAEALLLDDGLQNPTLIKDLSLLVVDGGSGFGNGRVLPAGPLREPVAAGAARCQAAVLIGTDDTGAVAQLPAGLPVLHARLEQGPEIFDHIGQRVLAFAGIGRPEKFFDGLARAGVIVVARKPFPDHHAYSAREIQHVLETAARLRATVVTTPKDAVRLPPALLAEVRVVGVRLAWQDDAAIEHLLEMAVGRSPSHDLPRT
jgi:tetraacyldisaccharide 4'-kinase